MNPTAIFTALGLNSIPALGWFFSNWSPGTTLAVYWFENLAGSLFLACEILVHRRFNPSRGHFKYSPPKSATHRANTFLSFYLPTALAFCFGHAVFLAVLLLLLLPQKFGPSAGIDQDAFLRASGVVMLVLVTTFLFQLTRLKRMPFRQIEVAAERSFGRIVVVQFVIIGGMFFVMMTDNPHWMFGIFIGLKTLSDLANFLPQYNPKTPPVWLSKIMNRIGPAEGIKGSKGKGKPRFEDYWQETDRDEEARQETNEKPRGSPKVNVRRADE